MPLLPAQCSVCVCDIWLHHFQGNILPVKKKPRECGREKKMRVFNGQSLSWMFESRFAFLKNVSCSRRVCPLKAALPVQRPLNTIPSSPFKLYLYRLFSHFLIFSFSHLATFTLTRHDIHYMTESISC